MSTLITLPKDSTTLVGPPCATCGKSTRLTGIEPHPTEPLTDLRTFQCVVCDAVQVQSVPLT